jgi:hypothetical protein
MIETRLRALIGAALVWALATGAAASTQAPERSGARTWGLQREVQILRPRALRTPGAAAYDLERVQRALHQQRIEAPRDPRLDRIEVETRQLRWQADRAARQARTMARPRTSALAGEDPPGRPRYPGDAYTHAVPPTAADVGLRIIALERDAAAIARRLAAGDISATARLLAAAEAEFAAVRGALSDATATDPNLVALDARLAGLRRALEQRRRLPHVGSNTSCTFM